MKPKTIAINLLSYVSILLTSCYPYGTEVERALRYAANNRGELEKVLTHYSQDEADSLKLRAACYLIKHMPHHTSYPAEPYAEYCKEMDSLFSREIDSIFVPTANKITEKYRDKLKLQHDILTISADYLIWNIDYSFEKWQTLPYLSQITFEQFCEYILPYKCLEKQPLTKWKLQWDSIGRGELDYLPQIEEYKYNTRRALEAVDMAFRDSLKMKVKSIDSINIIDIMELPTLLKLPYGTCAERSRLGLLNARSKSLPVSYDFTPNWADRDGTHSWNFCIATSRRNIDYEPFTTSYPGSYHQNDTKMSKVYRYSYEVNQKLLDAYNNTGELPQSLTYIFIKDVTAEYGRCANISVHININTSVQYGYLAVFDNNNWVPVDVSKIKNGKVSFTDVGVGILYTVVECIGGNISPICTPFIVDTKGQMKTFQTDVSNTFNLRLTRKFPSFAHIYKVNKYLQKGRIEAANNPDFINADSIIEFPEWQLLADEHEIKDTTKYRYWRLMASSNDYADFAEIYFYKRDSCTRIVGDIIWSGATIRNKSYDTAEHLIDGDPLTYCALGNVDEPRWVGFDFKEPVSISKIAYIRRGDGNDICPGDEYELYYWLDSKWQLHSKQTAETVYLDFKDVPSGGLYYIKGLSRGIQNRPFICENKQVVWY